MTRKQALAHLRVAFIKGDLKKATRLYSENRISRSVYQRYAKQFYQEEQS